ncbi:MAG: peptidoglycan-associated lipoprotein Pal [Gammaproteobacteria bacterium]
MKILSKLMILALFGALAGGCASKGPIAVDGDVDTSATSSSTTSGSGSEMGGAEVMPGPTDEVMDIDPLQDPASPLSKRVIYFDFDQSEIKPEFQSIIQAHATYMAEHPGVSAVLEGHADERGSREYNVGLGERRANAVSRFLSLQGASSSQIETVSYGEERPVAFGHDEDSWRLNRRVEIIYQGS